jgi:hypothetical protein
MQITDTVKVGGLTYIVERKNECCETNSNVDGRVLYDKQVIRIKHDDGSDYSKLVFLHEIIHAIFNFANIEQDEDTVERLTNGLYMVMKDNPLIFRKIEGQAF